MKVSLNWAQLSSNVNLMANGPAEIISKVGVQLGAIEEVIYWGAKYDGVVVARVVECAKHPNADKLNICKVDDGGVTSAERDENGLVQVVCGAPNIKKGLTVAWIPPGSIVPNTFGGAEPFVLGTRELRGVNSNGMIASLKELAIGDSHEGILEISAAEVGEELTKPGTAFKQLYGLDDVIIDCENKMFTHRPDCFGILGVARELAGIQQLQFSSPSWYQNTPTQPAKSKITLPLQASVETSLVSRFMAVAMQGVAVAPSPVYIQSGLSRVGIRPINNIVDITNWLMHLTGQPLHAYDYDKVLRLSGGSTATLIARPSVKGEQFSLLGGKTFVAQDDQAVLIATNTAPIGAGGILGGSDTEVDETTTNIIIECANFDMYNIRKTSMKYGLFTDAVSRFNKGQSPLQNDRIITQATNMVTELAGGIVASGMVDITSPNLTAMPAVEIGSDFINARLGAQLTANQIKKLLQNVEFKVELQGDKLVVHIPFWRRDIEIKEDIVEEVGRLHGYDKLPVELPTQKVGIAKKNDLLALKSKIRSILTAAGANEALTYNFVHGGLLTKVGQDTAEAFRLANAISPSLQYYRLSLTPGLLDKVNPNIRAGYDQFCMYEIGKTHNNTQIDAKGLPIEFEKLAVIFAANKKAATSYYGAGYYQARAYAELLFAKLGVTVNFVAIATLPTTNQVFRPFAANRSAVVQSAEGETIGIIGEYTQAVASALKLPDFTAGFELDTEKLLQLAQKNQLNYQPISKYPKVEQDISLKVKAGISYATIYGNFIDSLQQLKPSGAFTAVDCLDIYSPAGQSIKHVSFRLSIASYQTTLTSQDINLLLDKIAESLGASLGAQRI